MNATGSVLLDTSVVVDYLRQDPALHEKLDQAGDVYLPLVVFGELLYGVYESRQKEKMLVQVREFSVAVF